jgi:cytochrome P450 PksS
MTPVKEVDLSRPAFKANPYPFYARWRAEAPVCPLALADKRSAWLVTRYDDVVALLKEGSDNHRNRKSG